jgi:hypothetical protein
VPKDTQVSAEFTGPVKISFFSSGSPVETTVDDTTTVKLQNFFTEATADSMAGDTREKTYFFIKVADDTHLELHPSISVDYITTSPYNVNQDPQTMANDFNTHSLYKFTVGENTYEIPPDKPIVFEGSLLKLTATPAPGQTVEWNLEKLKEEQSKGVPQFVVKEAGFPLVAQLRNINFTAPKTVSNQSPISATATEQKGGGGGCMQLDPSYNASSTAWVWLTMLSMTGIVIGRRRCLRNPLK